MILKKRLAGWVNRPMYVSTGAYRRYFTHSLVSIHGDILEAVRTWVKPGEVIWDVGANVGVFTFAAAVAAGSKGKVFSFEANVDCANLISRSLKWKRADEADIVICPFAISERAGTVSFEISSYRSAASAIAGFGRFDKPRGEVREVPAFSLDQLSAKLPPPNLIKIDVEGAENLVLRGAREMILKYRPTILVECSGGETGQESGQLFGEMSYEWKAWTEPGEFRRQGIPDGDTVAVPIPGERL